VGANGTTLVADSAETTGLKWAAPSSGALALINTYTLSAVTSQTMDNIFTSTYDNYYLILNCDTSTTDNITMALRASGSDTTTGYSSQEFGATNTTLFSGRTTGARIGAGGASERITITLTLTAPNLAKKTNAIANNVQVVSGDVTMINYYLAQSSTTQFDGLKIITAAGTMTGTISVYGYAK
jgi:hypothetical protein